MELSRRSWHMRLGQWVKDGGWMGRWTATDLTPYQPRHLCEHVLIVCVGPAAALTMNLLFAVLFCVLVPLGLLLYVLPEHLAKNPPFTRQAKTVSDSLLGQWLAARKRNVCPLIELED